MLKRGLGMDKKGQDITIGTLILIVLGLVVLVLLIVGFTVGWDFIISKFRIAPGQTLEAVAQSCKFSGQNNLKIDYCGFKELKIEGKKQFINCQDPRIENVIKGDLDINPDTFCQGFDKAQEYCIRKGLKPTILINNDRCDNYVQYNDQGKPIPPTGFGLTCQQIGFNDGNPQRSTQWRDPTNCVNTPNDNIKYDIVNNLVTDILDKQTHLDMGEVCCEIIDDTIPLT